MKPHLVFKADHSQVVAGTGRTIGVRDQLGHHEQADPFGTRHPIGQAGEYEVADVLCKIVIGPADVDLLAGDGVAAVPIGLCLGPKGAHVATGLRFSEVHGAAPFARYQLGNVKRLDLIRGMMLQRLDLALGHQGVELEGKAGPGHHIVDRRGQGHRQAHSAISWVRRHPDPAALGHRPVAFGETR